MTRARSQREAGAPLAAGRAARALPRAGSEGRLEREGGGGGGGGGGGALCRPADGRGGGRHNRVARAGGRAASHLAAHVQEQVDRQQHQHLRGSAGLF